MNFGDHWTVYAMLMKRTCFCILTATVFITVFIIIIGLISLSFACCEIFVAKLLCSEMHAPF